MYNLVENILTENYVEASNIFEDRLNNILEMKLVEMKKMIQAESSINPYRDTKSRVAKGYVPASKVLKDPRGGPLPSLSSKIEKTAKTTKKLKQSTAPANDDNDMPTRERQSKLLSKVPNEGLPRLMAKSAAQDRTDKYERIMKRAKDLESRGHRTAVSRLRNSPGGKVARAGREGENFGRAMGGFAKNIITGLGGLAEE